MTTYIGCMTKKRSKDTTHHPEKEFEMPEIDEKIFELQGETNPPRPNH